METKLLYMDDWNIITAQAKLLELVNRDNRSALVLDQTIFYPQGGGQPADHGEIVGKTGVFKVADTRFSDGNVYHFGEFVQGALKAGDLVTLNIDRTRRTLLSRLHTAGHLIDVAMENLKKIFKPTKAYHFTEGPYVEYEATLTPEECGALQELLQSEITRLLATSAPVTGRSMTREALEGICSHVPDYLPAGKPIRVVTIGNFVPCPCGGTHVASLSELGQVVITKIKSKGGILRVSYQISEIV